MASSADEIALEFDDVFHTLTPLNSGGSVSNAAKEKLEAMNEILLSMSGSKNAFLWTFDSLSSAKEWEEVRKSAEIALKEIDKKNRNWKLVSISP